MCRRTQEEVGTLQCSVRLHIYVPSHITEILLIVTLSNLSTTTTTTTTTGPTV